MIYFEVLSIKGGRRVTSIIKAQDKEHATELARVRKLGRVLKVKPGTPPLNVKLEEYIGSIKKSLGSKNKVTMDDLIASFRQISMMLNVGISIHQTLQDIIDFTNNNKLKAIFEDVLNGIDSGKSMSECFRPYKKDVGALAISLIDLGEQTGDMPSALDTLTIMLEEIRENVAKFKKALRYPLFTIFAMAVAFVILITVVVPKFRDIFSKMNAELPLPTIILLKLEEYVSNYGIIALVVGVVLGIVGRYYYYKSEAFQLKVDRFALKLYLIGKLIHLSASYQYLSTLSELIKAGIPLEESLRSASTMINNLHYRNKFDTVPEAINRGVNLTDAFKNIDVFETIPIQMISTGEKSGSLDQMLKTASNFYKMKYDSAIDNISASIEPLLTAFIAALVLLLALGIFLPMWDMASAVKGG
ncbi:MAG: type II secretion system F family protein [Campylobacterales bacterium]